MVDYVSVLDFYEIRLASLLSNVDKDVLIELYQPLIGAQSTILYLTLLKQARNAEDEDVYSMDLLLKNTQMTNAQLLNARQFLEGVGLLKTFEQTATDKRSFIFILYAPKTPKDFFDDVLFKGLLIQAVGEKEALRLASKYEINLNIPEGYKDVSASFKEMFSIDYDDPSFLFDINTTVIGHKTRNVKLEFKYDKFFQYLEENSQIRRSVFNNREMMEIERVASLYSLDEKDMAFIIIDTYRPYEDPHLVLEDITSLAKERIKLSRPRGRKPSQSKSETVVNSDSMVLKKAKLMDEKSPIKYLKLLQGNTNPSANDIEIVENLYLQYNFSYGVINAIIDYTLVKCNNILNEKFIDKVASGVAREQLSDALSTMNYLSKKKERKSSYKPYEVNKEKEEIKVVDSNPQEEISDEEMNSILDSFSKRKGGKK